MAALPVSTKTRLGRGPDYDPSLAAIVGPYTATFHDYVRGDLEIRERSFFTST